MLLFLKEIWTKYFDIKVFFNLVKNFLCDTSELNKFVSEQWNN